MTCALVPNAGTSKNVWSGTRCARVVKVRLDEGWGWPYGQRRMIRLPLCLIAFAVWFLGKSMAVAEPETARSWELPCVYIVCGAPGSDDHHAAFEKRLAALKRWFIEGAGVPAANVNVYYGPESAGYHGTGTRANIEKLCKTVVGQTQGGRPVWLILTGHANDAPGDVRFNLPGDDLSGKELAGWLAGAASGEGAAPLTVILATACSGRAVKHLAGPNRAIMAATNASEGADEPVFGDCLLDALARPQTDADKDGTLSLHEIFLATRAAVLGRYKEGGFILTEHAGLDGNGDGRATQRPAEMDATAAASPNHSLKLKSNRSF